MKSPEINNNAQILLSKQRELIGLVRTKLFGSKEKEISFPDGLVMGWVTDDLKKRISIEVLKEPKSPVCKYTIKIANGVDMSGIEYRLNDGGSMNWTTYSSEGNGNIKYGVTPINADEFRYDHVINLLKL